MADVETLHLKVDTDAVSALLGRVTALAEYIGNADVGDPIAELARSVGELQVEDSIKINARFASGRVVVDAVAIGALKDMLDAYDAHVRLST